MSFVGFRKLSDRATIPKTANFGDVGYDLSSAYSYTVKAHKRELIKTDLQVCVPFGTYGRIAPRSGLAWKSAIDVLGGVIDPGYEGNVCVLLINHGDTDFEIKSGDRIAQLILEQCKVVPVYEFHSDKKEPITNDQKENKISTTDTARGDKGFGSTGVSS